MRNRTGSLNNARVPRRSGVGGLFAVPGLVELLADPEQIGVLDAHTRRALKTQVINALILLHNQDIDAASAETDATCRARDRLLDVNQAAEKLGVKADWLYRHHRDCRSRCGTANCCASRRSGSKITSANGAVEKSASRVVDTAQIKTLIYYVEETDERRSQPPPLVVRRNRWDSPCIRRGEARHMRAVRDRKDENR